MGVSPNLLSPLHRRRRHLEKKLAHGVSYYFCLMYHYTIRFQGAVYARQGNLFGSKGLGTFWLALRRGE